MPAPTPPENPNPYDAVREAILASGATGLLAGVARDEAGCGCAFGAAFGEDPGGSFTSAMIPNRDRLYTLPREAAWLTTRQRFRAWAAERGLTYSIVSEIEVYNDTRVSSDPDSNGPAKCAVRLAIVLAWLTTRAEAWEKENAT